MSSGDGTATESLGVDTNVGDDSFGAVTAAPAFKTEPSEQPGIAAKPAVPIRRTTVCPSEAKTMTRAFSM